MSKYIAKVGEWITPSETTGSIQNISSNQTIEVTSNSEANEGLRISPMQIINFDGTIYVRSVGNRDATFTVVPFKISAGGGGGGGSSYSLPTASASVKGGIKIGSNLSITDEVLSAIFNDFASGVSYKVGDIVVYQNKLFTCKTAHTSGSVFDESKFNAIGGSSATVLYDWESNKDYIKNELVYYANSVYRCISSHTSSMFSSDAANWELIYSNIGNWVPNVYYSVGANVINDSALYICKVAHTSSSKFSATNWVKISGSDSYKIIDWSTGTKYSIDDVVYNGNSILRCKVAHTSSSTSLSEDISNWELLYSDIAEWEPSSYYIYGVVVIESNVLYRCNTSHTSDLSFDIFEKANWDIIGSSSGQITYWASRTSYSINDLVIYNNNLYKCTVAHISTTAFEAANFVMVGGIEYSYDLGEKEVGEWVDASRVYQKTYKYETPSTLNTFLKLGDLEQNVSQVIYIQVIMEREVSYVGDVPDINSLSDPDPIKVVAYNNALYCKLYDNSQAQKDVYITVQYTKSS